MEENDKIAGMEVEIEEDFEQFFKAREEKPRESDRGPSVKIEQLDAPEAFPCRDCGRYPRLHSASFKNKEKYPKTFYVDCGGCSQCDGKWYSTREEAVSAWNLLNKGAKPRPPDARDRYDFIHDICKDIRIPD